MSGTTDGTARHCVIIPSYNTGPLLADTVCGALEAWQPVIVVIDGSTDGSETALRGIGRDDSGLHIVQLPSNGGKGAAVLAGLDHAASLGCTHAAVFDADGQHEAADLPRMMHLSQIHPEAMILGVPVFGSEAPGLRVHGRRVGNFWANLETWWGGIGDSLFGFRVYPVAAAQDILRSIRGGRRFDFDTQLAVRLYWAGVPPLNVPTRVRYPATSDGGVSHFRYLSDNLLLVRVHAGLLLHSFLLAPRLVRFRRRGPLAATS